MQLGEMVKVVIPDMKAEDECPFAHKPPTDEIKNELGGIGTKLGELMTAGTGVHKKPPPDGTDYSVGDKVPDPREKGLRRVTISVNEEVVTFEHKGSELPVPYPLTCAAHHLIPAQEALRDSPIVKFMCKAGEDQDFRKGGEATPRPAAGSKIWGNVGYNVNGSQNGVWLPGNYAVGAGTGGVEVWKDRKQKRKSMTDKKAAENWAKAIDTTPQAWEHLSKQPEEEEGPQKGVSAKQAATKCAKQQYMLAGKNYRIHPGNPKWAYVKAAMDAAGGQFHDRHGDYSKFVAKYLKKVAEVYAQMYDTARAKKTKCTECEKAKRPKGANASQLGPPYGIVARLVACSNFFKGFVQTQSIKQRQIFTSKWILAWINAPKKFR